MRLTSNPRSVNWRDRRTSLIVRRQRCVTAPIDWTFDATNYRLDVHACRWRNMPNFVRRAIDQRPGSEKLGVHVFLAGADGERSGKPRVTRAN